VAIVTGAATGLGRAYAKRLAGLGAKVAVADLHLRSYEEFEAEARDMTAESTIAEIEASGGTALGIEVDVRDHESVEAMVADRRTVSYSCAPSDGPHGATAVPSASGGGRSGLHLRRRQLACGGAYIFRGRNGAHIRCDPNPSGSGWWRERATIAADDTAKLAGLHRGSGDELATYLPRY